MMPLPPGHAEVTPYDDGSGLVKVTSYATDGTILEQGDYLNNFREGVYTEFHVNGYVKTTCGYVRGKKQGQWVSMDDKGQLLERGTYHLDVLNGPYVIYNRSRIKETRNYVNGELNGQVEKFYPNGTIMERSNYTDGQLDGVARWYDQQGNLSIEYTYKNGELSQEGTEE
jgi:antitoxin component YwqK of YwqJK toxin-antitoxin module